MQPSLLFAHKRPYITEFIDDGRSSFYCIIHFFYFTLFRILHNKLFTKRRENLSRKIRAV